MSNKEVASEPWLFTSEEMSRMWLWGMLCGFVCGIPLWVSVGVHLARLGTQ